MAICKACGARIDFVKLTVGRRNPHPVNLKYMSLAEAAVGTTLITDSGKVFVKKDGEDLKWVKGRQSHFSTCPKAEDFRTNKGAP